MKRPQKLFLMVACLLLPCMVTGFHSFAQDEVLPAYTLVAELPDKIAFQDLKSDRVWNWSIPNLIYDYNYHVDSWTPDGCRVVMSVLTDAGFQTILLSVNNLEYTEIPFGEPLWSPDGTSIFYRLFDRSADSTSIYRASSLSQDPELFHSFDMWVGHTEWLSDHEWVLYGENDQYYVWNLQTKQVRLFEPNPLTIGKEQEIQQPFYDYGGEDHISPDWTMTAGFNSMIYFREVIGPDRELSEAKDAELQSQIPTIPGLDIFFLAEGVRRHVDVNGQFIKSLVWSPTSQQIAVTTDSEGDDYGIYIYDVRRETLSRISDAYHDLWFQVYLPSWSPDGKWLAFRSPAGYSAQHMPSGQIIRLDTIMNQSQTLLWSPATDYARPVCISFGAN